MQIAPLPANEKQRIAALHALNILDTEAEERFDRITRLARRLFDTSIATVSLVDSDRQWFKSKVGTDGCEDVRDNSFCAHAILASETMVVEDATSDPRFADNPLVLGAPKIRFYAGHPVAAPSGETIGTLCVIDDRPRLAQDFDAGALRELAEMVEAEIASLALAIGDSLTGLSNRRGFEMLGEKLLKSARRLGLPVAGLYADLDNLKLVNDRLGHQAGDEALIEVARALEETLRDSDLVARLGGDEFCALLVGADIDGAEAAAARLEEHLQGRGESGEVPVKLSLSVGVVVSPGSADHDLWGIVASADSRMFAVKRARKDTSARPKG